MKIGLIDVDGHNFPNIPLMKISAWHKAQGDSVEWYDPMLSGHMDKVYMSKVFSFSPDYQYFIDADEIVQGGSGYCISLVDGKEVYIIPIPENLQSREAMAFATASIGGEELQVWTFNDQELQGYSLLYVMDENGEPEIFHSPKKFFKRCLG